jgi:hypothetical protein
MPAQILVWLLQTSSGTSVGAQQLGLHNNNGNIRRGRIPWKKGNINPESKMVKVICVGEHFLTYVIPFCCEGKLRMIWDRSTHVVLYMYIFPWYCSPTHALASSFLWCLDHKQRRTTVGGTPLGECSACRRGFYMTKQHWVTDIHDPDEIRTRNLSAGQPPQTYALDGSVTETGYSSV